MAWQQQVLDVALEMDPVTKRLVYREVILTVPRQSGKTTLLLVLILLRALSTPKQTIYYTAQTGTDARKKWLNDWLPVLQESSFATTFRPRKANGQESLCFRNGSIQNLLATTKKTGHGGTVDLGILDESFAHPDARLEQALRPAMITRPQPQLWIVSTAGTPESSPYLLGKVEGGRQLAEAGVNQSTAYFEWSAADGLDAGDPATWWSCMPALGITATEDAVAQDFVSMSMDGKTSEFERAYLNRWKSALSDPVIPLEVWHGLYDASSAALDPICFALDVSPDRAHSAIAMAGKRRDGLTHVESIEQFRGTEEVAPRIAALTKAHRSTKVILDGTGPAGALLPELARLRVKVLPVNTKEHTQACGMFYDAAVQATIRHRGEDEMTVAVDGAVKRQTTDSWLWGRRASSVDISPLVAVTLAHWGHKTQRQKGASVIGPSDIERMRAERDARRAAEQGKGESE